MSAAVRAVVPAGEIEITEWARAERCVLELFEAERLAANAIDTELYPRQHSASEWRILLEAWRARNSI